MSETQERFSQIRRAAESAKERGITDVGERREVVINAVAKKDIRAETPEVIDIALNKYLKIEVGLPGIPVLIDAVHARRPTLAEVLRTKAPEVKKARDEWDEYTTGIARRVAELTGASLIIAKKSRLTSDLNRAWWARRERSGALAWEYPRSGRAALYWAIREILLNTHRLDKEEQLKSNFCRIAIHGMEGQPGFDYAIAGSREPADSEFVDWFFDKFKKSLVEVGLEPRVIIARSGGEGAAYSGPASLAHFRRPPQKESSVQHPAFGPKFQTIQLEIAAKIRKDPKSRKAISLAIANVIKEIK